MRVFFNAVFVQIILSAYVLWRGWNALPPKKVIRVPFVAFFILELIIYFLGFFFSHHLPFEALHIFAWVGTTWMVFIIYMTALLLLYDVVRFVNKKKQFILPSFDPKKHQIRGVYFLCSLALVIGVMAGGSYKFYHPTITEKTLEIDKYSPNIKDLKVVVVTDVHAGFLIDKDMLQLYIDDIMAQKPDLILLVGDIIDYDLRSLRMDNMQEQFRQLHAPYGVYGSTGNHEYIDLGDEETPEYKIKWLNDVAGITMLRDTAIMIDSTFYLVGREDDKCVNRKELPEIMTGVDKSYPIIVMNHEPHRLLEEVQAEADVAVYGHTHNGQFFPVNLILKFMYELPFGYKKTNNTHIYVSSGLGLAGPQYRIGTISEIVVLNLKFKGKPDSPIVDSEQNETL